MSAKVSDLKGHFMQQNDQNHVTLHIFWSSLTIESTFPSLWSIQYNARNLCSIQSFKVLLSNSKYGKIRSFCRKYPQFLPKMSPSIDCTLARFCRSAWKFWDQWTSLLLRPSWAALWLALCTVQLINTWRKAGLSRGFVDYSENGGQIHRYTHTHTHRHTRVSIESVPD